MRGPGYGSLALLRETSMKKTVKRLVLAKETLRSLDDKRLEQVGGGLQVNNSYICTYDGPCVPPDSINPDCQPPG
jgi:hypothetical protein